MANKEQTRECTIDQLQPRLGKLVKPYIPNGEQILCCFENKVDFPGGLFDLSVRTGSSCVICTQHRIIMSEAGPEKYGNEFRENVRIMDVGDILSVQEINNQFGFNVHLSGQGNNHLPTRFYDSQMAMKFAAVVRNAVAQAKARNQVAASPNSVEERIRALKQLRQDGLITEAQFQQKIQEIVNQL